MRRLILIAPILIAAQFLFGQAVIPDFGPLFLQDEVASVHITVDQDSLDIMLLDENLYNNHEYPAQFIYSTSSFTDTIQDVGFRLRGNTSREAAKKSFKVSFNAFSPGAKYLGVEKLNLNGEHNDPSLLRSKLNWDFIRYYNLAGSRTSFVRFYINGEYRGLYLNTEHIDENFVDTYFDKGNENLYKCLWPATLDYWGADPDLYKEEFFGRRAYELKTNTEADDYSDIAHFIDVLNNTPLEDLPCALEEVFNVHDYLKLLAIEVLIGHWDGYSYNKNNYYLYHNAKTDRFEYLHYDLDNTLGIDWLGQDWSERDVYDWSNEEPRPLYERVLEVDEYRKRYTFFLDQFTEEYFNDAALAQRWENWKDLISVAALEDEYRTYDYGFDDTAFTDAYDEAWDGHVSQAIGEYTSARVSSLADNLDAVEPFMALNHVRDNSPDLDTLKFKAVAEGQIDAVTLRININENGWEELEMFDDGLHDDREPNDGLFGLLLPLTDDMDNLMYEVTASSTLGEIIAPCEPNFIWTNSVYTGLLINELMPVNESFYLDEFGEAEDWIELYNNGDTPVSLGNKFLTDDIDNPGKWPMPQITLEPGEHVVFWADGQTDQGPLHTNFKLNGNGEEAGIFQFDLGAWHMLDNTSFGSMSLDESWGLEFDGWDNWVVFTDNPTPNAPNGIVGVTEFDETSLIVWPNPTVGEVWFKNLESGGVFDIRGKQIVRFEQTTRVDFSPLPRGMYFICALSGHRAKVIRN